jgi:hypothetical protein
MSASTPRWPQFLAAAIALGFAVGVLVMDVFLGVVVTRQIVAQQTWTSTPGTIVSSTVTASRRVPTSATPTNRPRNTTARTTYRVKVSYTFTVGGREIVGDRISIAGFGDPQFRQESEAAGVYPQGSAVTVYYNPADPSQSALRVGLQPEMAFAGFILLTFNAALFYVIRVAARWVPHRRDPIRAYLLHDDASRAVLRLTSFGALDLGVVVFCVGSFVCVFVVAFAVPGAAVGGVSVLLMVGLVLFAAAAFTWRSLRLNSGVADIGIDRVLARLSLPRRAGEREPTEVAMSDIDRIEVVIDPDRVKDRRVTRRLIVHAAGLSEPREIARWLSAAQANLLAGWLRREIKLADEVDPEEE